MARLFFTGFEFGDASCLASNGGLTVVTSPAKTGTYAGRTQKVGAGTSYGEIGSHSASGVSQVLGEQTVVFSANVRFASFPASGREEIITYLRTGSAAAKFNISVNSSGNLLVYKDSTTLVATGSTVLSLNTNYRISCKTSSGSGATYWLNINGVTELSGSTATNSSDTSYVRIGSQADRNGQDLDIYWDDIAVDSSTDPGAIEVKLIKPISDTATAEWSGGTGSSNYAEVDEVPYSDTEYIQRAATGTKSHLFNLTSCATAGITGTVNGVRVFTRVREVTSSTSSIKTRMFDGTNTVDSTAVNTSSSFTPYIVQRMTDLAGGAWTTSSIDALKVGVSESLGISCRCSTVLVEVEYTPPATVPFVGSTTPASSASGAANATRNLVGSTTPASSAVGAAKATRNLIGSTTPASSAVGAVKATRNLVGSTTPASSASGAAKAARNLVGSTTPASSASGVANAARKFIGSLSSVSSTSSSMTISGAGVYQFIASSASSSSAVGAMKAARNLVGSTASSSSASGAAKAARNLVGISTPASSASGAARATRNLISSTTPTSSASGAASAARKMAGSTTPASSTVGAVRATRGLSGTISAGSGVAGIAAKVVRKLLATTTAASATAINLLKQNDYGAYLPRKILKAKRRQFVRKLKTRKFSFPESQ